MNFREKQLSLRFGANERNQKEDDDRYFSVQESGH